MSRERGRRSLALGGKHFSHARFHGVRREGVDAGRFLFAVSLCSFLGPSRSLSFRLYFPWCASHLLGKGVGGGQKGSLRRAATARTADRKRTVYNLAMI